MTTKLAVLGDARIVVLLAHGSESRAKTLSYADAITVLAEECGGDIKKFCGGLNLGGGRIETCLKDHAAKVSASCTSSLSTVMTPTQARQAQAAYAQVCRHWRDRWMSERNGPSILAIRLQPTTDEFN